VTPARRGPRRNWAAALAVGLAALAALATRPGSGAEPLAMQAPRIVAIGDVHGSIEGLSSILEEAGLIGGSGSWAGGSTTLVQIGDLLDRGVALRGVLDLLMRLEQEAPRSGGRVIVLLGNHEVMNLLGVTRDVNPDAYHQFVDEGSEQRRADALEAYAQLWRRREAELGREAVFTGDEAERWLATHPPGFVEYSEALGPHGAYGAWLRRRPAAVIVGETLFVHGGAGPRLEGVGVDEINRKVAAELAFFDETRAFMAAEGLALPWSSVTELVSEALREHQWIAAQSPAAVPRKRLNRASRLELDFATGYLMADDGPIWFRGLATWDELEHGAEVESLLDGLGVSRQVVGHCPQPDGRIRSRFAGRVLLIDSGMLASVYGGQPSALEIAGGTLTAIYPGGERELLGSGTPPPPVAATAAAGAAAGGSR
jgi:hypothetical protein